MTRVACSVKLLIRNVRLRVSPRFVGAGTGMGQSSQHPSAPEIGLEMWAMASAPFASGLYDVTGLTTPYVSSSTLIQVVATNNENHSATLLSYVNIRTLLPNFWRVCLVQYLHHQLPDEAKQFESRT